MDQTHPGQSVMSYAEFLRQRQEACHGGRGKDGFRCC